ncbi:MAG: succinate dehydrogenase cytochrome b subunit [Opitutales bacterium]|nr:succinate dehydrogenase cytochrome b subunit [Opitutales bacterium]
MRIPSLVKKFLMAITGLALVGFVFGHLVGNLQVYLDPYFINAYALKLKELGPALWAIRAVLLAIIVVHVVMAIALTRENRAARPERYKAESTVQATYASRTMPASGLIIFLFIVFHLAHYTVRVVPGHEYDDAIKMANGDVYQAMIPLEYKGEVKADKDVLDVHTMLVAGFSYWWISAIYIVAMALLSLHLNHGVSSMFQSLGFRNAVWRKRLDFLSRAFAIFIFVGFVSIPVAVLAGAVNIGGLSISN